MKDVFQSITENNNKWKRGYDILDDYEHKREREHEQFDDYVFVKYITKGGKIEKT